MLGLNGKGVDVVVRTRVADGTDAFRATVYKDVDTTVRNVLIAPGAVDEVDGTNRPEGVVVAYTLHWPKDSLMDLTGATVLVPDGFGGVDECRVIGSPRPNRIDLTPGDWAMRVEVHLVDG